MSMIAWYLGGWTYCENIKYMFGFVIIFNLFRWLLVEMVECNSSGMLIIMVDLTMLASAIF